MKNNISNEHPLHPSSQLLEDVLLVKRPQLLEMSRRVHLYVQLMVSQADDTCVWKDAWANDLFPCPIDLEVLELAPEALGINEGPQNVAQQLGSDLPAHSWLTGMTT